MFDPSMQQQQPQQQPPPQQQQAPGAAQMYQTDKSKEDKGNPVDFPFCYNVNMVPKGQGDDKACYRFDVAQPFGYNYALVNQMSLAAAASTATFKCDVCGLVFGHLTLLNHHKRIHTANANPAAAAAPGNSQVVNSAQQPSAGSVDRQQHTCDICGAVFSMPGELKAHKNQMHKAPAAPKCCNSCGVEVPCDQHNKKKGKFVKCGSCLESAAQQQQQQQQPVFPGNGTAENSGGEASEVSSAKPGHHPVKRRGMATVTKCQKCNGSGIIFVGGARRELIEKPRRHVCDTCGAAFARYSSLWSHRRLHTGEKPYKCGVCGMQFSQSPHLKNHERIHSGERPYQCEVCDKVFARHSTLWNHRRIHTGEKPYRCEICGSSFNQATHLKNHNKVHTGEKPHRCDICDVAFSDRFALKRHRGIHEKYGRTAPSTPSTTPNGTPQQQLQSTDQQAQPEQVMEQLYKCEVQV
ncbi:zinc finger protein 678-like isoform X2 [Thrips palmi]|uniref:Zinc finger protein 678-like isoform X2 n=1 Tax=Thrips palmi TaxID=161013 RepID=A0A6P8XYG4_THRPL|nr:zinc finger protein 678-like isoform X2 [Thrips palmi]